MVIMCYVFADEASPCIFQGPQREGSSDSQPLIIHGLCTEALCWSGFGTFFSLGVFIIGDCSQREFLLFFHDCRSIIIKILKFPPSFLSHTDDWNEGEREREK